MTTVALVAFAASGLMGTSALASPVRTAADPTTKMIFDGGTTRDNMRRCHAYGYAGQVAGKWRDYTCVEYNGAFVFTPLY
ncbi:hypothetical protein AB0I81_44165 [Nonomuraea sp. NPDC050404]|uniref:hypothetical protein n=1 Tax=Nonomuraea sp. NPDC050404 TaxID=3155783 RepID=UPI0033EED3A3